MNRENRTALAHAFYKAAEGNVAAGHDPDDVLLGMVTATIVFAADLHGLERLAGLFADCAADLAGNRH